MIFCSQALEGDDDVRLSRTASALDGSPGSAGAPSARDRDRSLMGLATENGKETVMADVVHHVERLPLSYAQAQAEYKSATDRPMRPSTYRSGWPGYATSSISS